MTETEGAKADFSENANCLVVILILWLQNFEPLTQNKNVCTNLRTTNKLT